MTTKKSSSAKSSKSSDSKAKLTGSKTKNQVSANPEVIEEVKDLDPIPAENQIHAGQDTSQEPEPIPVVDILIPFVTQTVKWEELKFALRSIEKFVTTPHRVIILGSERPEWASEKLLLIKCEQIQGFENAKAFDAVAKLEKAIDSDISTDFVYTYDDVVFLNHVTLEDLKVRVSHDRLKDENNIQGFTGSARWKKVMINTLLRLKVNKLPDFNYETHLPRVFNKELLKTTFLRFGFKRWPYMVPTIYFNSNFEGPDVILDASSPTIEISKPLPYDLMKELLCSKKILTYNDNGLTEDLKEILLEMFPEKSTYEK